MSDNPRDTQFAGFAKALLLEMLANRQGEWIDFNSDDALEVEEYSAIIARRAYDLVTHVIDHAPASVSGADDWHIPDMTKLPKESSDETL